MDDPGKRPMRDMGECGPVVSISRYSPNLRPRVSIVDDDGKLLARIGDISGPGNEPGQFISPHDITVNSRGDVYVDEVSATAWPQLRAEILVPDPLNALRKLIKLPAA